MTARRILSTYYRIAGLHTLAASLVWGVNTLFLLDAGLDIAQVFLVNATATAAIVLFEIPTGVVADARGRRTSLFASVACFAAGNLIYVAAKLLAGGPALFCGGALLMGLGTTFYSGAVEAWLVDALGRAGHREPLAQVLARSQILTGATTVVGTVAGGVLASFDLAVPYLLRLLLLAALFVLAARTMEEPEREPPSAPRSLAVEVQRLARASAAFGWRQPAVRSLLLLGLLHYGFLTWAFHAWQPYFLELLGRDAPWVAGVVSALITLAAMGGNLLAARSGESSASWMLAGSVVLTASALGVGLASSFPAAVFFLLAMSAATGVVGPVKQATLHRLTPPRQRATVLSFDSLLGNAGAAGGQGALGALARQHGIAGGYLAGGIVTVLALPLLEGLRRRLDGAPLPEAKGRATLVPSVAETCLEENRGNL